MKLTDKYLTLSEAQQITTASSTEASENKLDLVKTSGNNLDLGTRMHLRVEIATVDTAATGITVAIQDSADNSSFTTVASKAFSAFTAGSEIVMQLPNGLRRYVQLLYTTAGAGGDCTVNAALCPGGAV